MKSRFVNQEPTLYIVATPIGHLGDITLRALDVLKTVDVIACEDTRTSGVLLRHYGITTRTMSYHDHNGETARPKILSLLREGKSVALISDAGTPLISDPGYKLVRACRDAGIHVTTVPGASSVTAALTLAGLPTDQFLFLGFLPTTTSARTALLEPLREVSATLVIFSTGAKIAHDLHTLDAVFGDRRVTLTRELTKLHETVLERSLRTLLEDVTARPPKGELVLVLAGGAARVVEGDALDALLRERLTTLSLKAAVEEVSGLLGLPRNQVYARALALKPAP